MKMPGGFFGGAIIGCVVAVSVARLFLWDAMPDELQWIGTILGALILAVPLFMVLSLKPSFNDFAMIVVFGSICGYAIYQSHLTGGMFVTVEESGLPWFPWIHPGIAKLFGGG